MIYRPSALEEWISEKYIQEGIMKPEDLQRDILGEKFAFECFAMPSPAFVDRDTGLMIIDSRVSLKKQTEQFFHEFCHLLFHTSKGAPDMYRKYLEGEALNLTKYAAIPYHMLDACDYNENVLRCMSEKFKVSLQLCYDRLLYIKNQLIGREPVI